MARLLAPLALWLALAGTYLLYRPGRTAGFQFDDGPNLSDLGEVVDAESASAFVLGGSAGPLGRPIALASFLLNGYAWPEDYDVFFHTNVLIHLLNGALVGWLAFRLARALPTPPQRPEWLAVAVSAAWTAHPLLASTSLMVVQRMTSLSATFALATLIAYVACREGMRERPVLHAVIAAAVLAAGTALSSLAKENGVLLPFFALAMEATILGVGLPAPRWFGRWKWVFFGGPAILLIAYVAYTWPGIVRSYDFRPFDLQQRLLTEGRILWDYVGALLLPSQGRLVPFQENYPLSTSALSPPVTVLALLGLAGALAAAVAGRKRYPIAAFAVLWFLAGHLLESTVFSLELYFQHRNYLPSFGPLFAIACAAFLVPLEYRRLAALGLCVYVALFGWVLLETTRVWGQPIVAAKWWTQMNPGSWRAAQGLSREYSRRGDPIRALQTIERALAENPRDASLAVQTLQLACALDTPEKYDARFRYIVGGLGMAAPTLGALPAAHKLVNMYVEGECANATPERLHGLADAMLANPLFARLPLAVQDLHMVHARVYDRARDLDSTMRHMEAAFNASPALPIALMKADALSSAGLRDDAIASLDRSMERAPANAAARRLWDRHVGAVRERIKRERDGPPA